MPRINPWVGRTRRTRARAEVCRFFKASLLVAARSGAEAQNYRRFLYFECFGLLRKGNRQSKIVHITFLKMSCGDPVLTTGGIVNRAGDCLGDYRGILMLSILAAIAALAGAVTHAPSFLAERGCLAEAVLAESELAKEPEDADQMVAYDIYQRSVDGRWGKTLCDTVAMKYPLARCGWCE